MEIIWATLKLIWIAILLIALCVPILAGCAGLCPEIEGTITIDLMTEDEDLEEVEMEPLKAFKGSE